MHFDVLKPAQDTADVKTIQLQKTPTHIIHYEWDFEWCFGPWMGDTPTEVKLYIIQSHNFWDFSQWDLKTLKAPEVWKLCDMLL